MRAVGCSLRSVENKMHKIITILGILCLLASCKNSQESRQQRVQAPLQLPRWLEFKDGIDDSRTFILSLTDNESCIKEPLKAGRIGIDNFYPVERKGLIDIFERCEYLESLSLYTHPSDNSSREYRLMIYDPKIRKFANYYIPKDALDADSNLGRWIIDLIDFRNRGKISEQVEAPDR